MKEQLLEKKPEVRALTREEVERLLDECIERKAKHWGSDSYYTRQKRERKEKVLTAFDNGGEPVPIAEVNSRYEDGGWEFRYVLYTDGSIHEEVYRM